MPETTTLAAPAAVVLTKERIELIRAGVVGANWIAKGALCPGPKVSGKLKPITLRSPPEKLPCVTARSRLPTLFNKSVLVGLLPMGTSPKTRLVGLTTS